MPSTPPRAPTAIARFSGKPAAVVGISVGAIGTATAQQHLRNVLAYLNMHVLGQPEVFLQYKDGLFGPDGQIANADSRKFLQGFIGQFLGLIGHLKR